MKLLLSMAIAAATLLAADGATYIAKEKVSEALAKGGPLHSASDLSVSGSHRTGPGQVEVHDKETDVMYVIDGHAVVVTGGKLVGGKSTKAGQWLGTDIQGGETHHLGKGDVLVVPAGTPHWFKEVPGPISYYVVKVIRQ